MSRYAAIGFIVILKVKKEEAIDLIILRAREDIRRHAKDTLERASLSIV